MSECFSNRQAKVGAIDRIWAVVLAGGLGTRLRPVVKGTPKVMAPVNGRPFMCYLLDWLRLQGLRRVVLCTGYLGRQVREYFGNSYNDLQLFYTVEKKPLGTAGAIKPALPMVDSQHLLVLNGDSFCPLNLEEFFKWHVGKGAMASMVTTFCRNAGRFGSVSFDGQGKVIGFYEKSRKGNAAWINAGIYLFETAFISRILKAGPSSMELDILPELVGNGLFAYPNLEEFIDIGIPEDYMRASDHMAELSAVEEGKLLFLEQYMLPGYIR